MMITKYHPNKQKTKNKMTNKTNTKGFNKRKKGFRKTKGFTKRPTGFTKKPTSSLFEKDLGERVKTAIAVSFATIGTAAAFYCISPTWQNNYNPEPVQKQYDSAKVENIGPASYNPTNNYESKVNYQMRR